MSAYRRRLSRRALLRGAGGVALALPFLDAMSRSASADVFPRRFIVFFTGLGTIKDAWVPTGTETDFVLGEVLSPLAPFQDKLLVLEGLDMESAHHGPGDPHQLGIGHALTGTELQEGDLFPYACNPSAKVGWGGGISLDQYLATQLGATTRFGSLEFGVQVLNASVSSRISYLGPGQPVPPEDNPRTAFERIFMDLASDPESQARRRAHRRQVLDLVMDDFRELNGKLGAGDREKLDNHLTAVEEIEKRLDAPGVVGGSCTIPVVGEPPDPLANDNYPEIGRLQMDLLVQALACDLTRVASLQWSSTLVGKVFTWLGQNETHHQLSHSSSSDQSRRQQIIDIGKWHSEQLAYLMGKLAAVPEGTGTLLDNTVILWCTDIAVGQTHARRDMPYVVAGGAGGALQTGRYLRYQGNSHNDLLVAIANALDVGISTFGNPAYCTGKLPGLGV